MKNFALRLKDCYIRNNTGPFAAALAYYLLFSIFPVVGVFNILLSAMGEEVTQILSVMPSFMKEIIELYMDYIAGYPGITLFSTSLFAFLYMPFRAVKFMLHDIGRVYGLEHKDSFARRNFMAFIYTAVFLVILVFTAVMMAASTEFLRMFIGETLTKYVKYLLPGIAMFWLLIFIYRAGSKRSILLIYKGAAFASLGWLIASFIFSAYVNTMGRYSIVYGSLGTLMAFFVWTYLTCYCILLGSRFNYVWETRNAAMWENNKDVKY